MVRISQWCLLLPILCVQWSFGQAPQESYKKLDAHSEKIQTHALKIKYGESRTQREHKIHTEEISKQLDSAILLHNELKEKMPRRSREKVQKENMAIEKHQLEAKRNTEALKTELSKQKHDEMAVRHYASRVQASIEKASKEEEILKEKTAK
jgi:hypothetical protein